MKLHSNRSKPQNNNVRRQKNTKEVITNQNGTGMVKIGEDLDGLATTRHLQGNLLFAEAKGGCRNSALICIPAYIACRVLSFYEYVRNLLNSELNNIVQRGFSNSQT